MSIFGGNNQNNGSIDQLLRQLSSQFVFGRVLSIDQSQNVNTNGSINVEIMRVRASPEASQIVSAQPFFTNIKNYPLTNEVVFLVTGPKSKYSQNTGGTTYYYFSPLNMWGNVNTNPTPNPYANTSTVSTQKSISQIEAGAPNQTSTQPQTSFKPGTYFEEKSNIFPIYPFEGDTIIEGRFGNSIRFGSTNILDNTPLNNWSNGSVNGDPITIIRNGQNPNLTGSAQSLVVEDINQDLSDIWLTSTQQIPISASSTFYDSYQPQDAPTTPNQYAGKQIIINSGRLLFNTTEDHLMFSSKKSINLNAVQSVNIDVTGPFVVQAGEIFLGSKDANESVLLGDSTVELLKSIFTDIGTLLSVMSQQVTRPTETGLGALATIASAVQENLSGYIAQLEDVKSEFVKVE
jgi:hypothetical protein